MKSLLQRLGLFHAAVYCYACTVVLRLTVIRIFCRRPLLVLFRAGGLGDIISTFPSVEELRKRFSGFAIIYVTRPEFCEIKTLVTGIDFIIGVLHGDAVARVVSTFFEVRRFTYNDEFSNLASTKYIVEEMAESVGVILSEKVPSIKLEPMPAEEIENLAGQTLAKKLVVIHTGPTAPVRQWDIPKWEALVTTLTREKNVTVFQIGVRRHFLYGAGGDEVKGTVSCLDGLSILQAARLIKSSVLFIGVDSGPLHLAIATGTPAVALFGPVNPTLRIPAVVQSVTCSPMLPCQFCHHHTPRLHWETGCPFNLACMKQIEVSTVAAHAMEIIGNAA